MCPDRVIERLGSLDLRRRPVRSLNVQDAERLVQAALLLDCSLKPADRSLPLREEIGANPAGIEAFVTNQARGNYFGKGELRAEPCTIYFPIEPKAGTQGIKTAFNTFGKLPGENRCYLHIIFRDTAGREILASEDITEQFINPGHHIVVDDPVDVPEPEPSGIAPTVEPWEEVIHDVPIG